MNVAHPVMEHSWQRLTFLHWSFDVDDVQRLLPPGLTVQPFENRAWVGLVPFRIVVGLPRLPSVPWLARFPETNVRTYVTDGTGRSGIWFFSLDADRLAAVVTAKVTYRLPYVWSTMTIEQQDDLITYRSSRRWPGPAEAFCNATIRMGEQYLAAELTQLDHFLTARWTLFSAHSRGLHYADAFHEPWPLHRGEVVELKESLITSAGLPPPSGDPLVHYSPNVDVTIGLPHRVKTAG